MPEREERLERGRLLGDGRDDAWKEPGSDELMDFDVLVRVHQIAQLVELERARKIRRRGE